MLRKVISTFVSAIVLCTGISVNASDLFTPVVSYTPESGDIKVSGVATKGTVTVMIVPESTVVGELDENSLPVFFRPYNVGDGEYQVVAGMPDDADGGKYKVYVSNNGEEFADSFVYMNITKGEEVIPVLNQKDGDGFSELVDENAINLGIDVDDAGYIAKKSRIYELLDKMTFTDIYDFYDKYISSYALCMIEGEGNYDAIDNIISKYDENLGIDYSTDFAQDSRLNDGIRSELFIMLSQTDYSKEASEDGLVDFRTIFKNLKAVAAAKNVSNWVGLKNVITGDFEDEFKSMLLSNNLYDDISDKDAVYEEMMSLNIDSMKNIEASFNTAVSYIYDYENSRNNGGSAGGSSGGKGFGGGISSAVTTPPASQLESELEGDTNKISLSDIDSSHWAYTAVMALSKDSVINGYEDGTFRPSGYITRAEFTKMILSFAQSVPNGQTVEFSDVNTTDWYYTAVTEAASKGLVSGTENGFNPDANIKREDAALIVYRLLNLLEKSPRGYRPFADRKDISDYAKDAVYTLGGAYIINGDEDNMFHPQNSITRAEAAQLLYNALKKN